MILFFINVSQSFIFRWSINNPSERKDCLYGYIIDTDRACICGELSIETSVGKKTGKRLKVIHLNLVIRLVLPAYMMKTDRFLRKTTGPTTTAADSKEAMVKSQWPQQLFQD